MNLKVVLFIFIITLPRFGLTYKCSSLFSLDYSQAIGNDFAFKPISDKKNIFKKMMFQLTRSESSSWEIVQSHLKAVQKEARILAKSDEALFKDLTQQGLIFLYEFANNYWDPSKGPLQEYGIKTVRKKLTKIVVENRIHQIMNINYEILRYIQRTETPTLEEARRETHRSISEERFNAHIYLSRSNFYSKDQMDFEDNFLEKTQSVINDADIKLNLDKNEIDERLKKSKYFKMAVNEYTSLLRTAHLNTTDSMLFDHRPEFNNKYSLGKVVEELNLTRPIISKENEKLKKFFKLFINDYINKNDQFSYYEKIMIEDVFYDYFLKSNKENHENFDFLKHFKLHPGQAKNRLKNMIYQLEKSFDQYLQLFENNHRAKENNKKQVHRNKKIAITLFNKHYLRGEEYVTIDSVHIDRSEVPILKDLLYYHHLKDSQTEQKLSQTQIAKFYNHPVNRVQKLSTLLLNDFSQFIKDYYSDELSL